MTWIRWDTKAPRSDVIGFLADELEIELALALGLYNGMCCGFGDDRKDGRIDAVSDATLEGWAMWRGKRGRFAAAIRAWCQRAELEGGDPGLLRGWWRNEAALRKQMKDAGKPDGRKNPPPIPPESREGFSGELRGDRGGNDNDNGNSSSETSSELQVASEGRAPEVECAVAANAGLRANPKIKGFNELLPQQAYTPVRTWLADGIPLATIVTAIQETATSYKPEPHSPQPSSFAYFDKPVRKAHTKAIGTAVLRKADAEGTPVLTPTAQPARRLPRLG